MKSLIHISAGLFLSAALITSASANDHKILGIVAMPRNETNDLTLKLPVCRVIKRIQLTADRGDIQLPARRCTLKPAIAPVRTSACRQPSKKGQPPTGLTLIATTITNAA